jgi:lysophospholipase L1-like esterase
VINLGVAGSTARQDGTHSYWDSPQWSIAAEVRIDIAVIMLGINDAQGKRWPKAEYVQDYLKMVQEILRLHSNATIFVAVPPQGAYAFQAVGRGWWRGLRNIRHELAAAVEEVVREAHLETPPINFYDTFAAAAKDSMMASISNRSIIADAPSGGRQHTDSMFALFLEDGIHPTAFGYNRMAKACSCEISSAVWASGDIHRDSLHSDCS